jgi:hypothetical protein
VIERDAEWWKERALRLARLIDDALDQPAEHGCWVCGSWFEDDGSTDHAPDCIASDISALIDEIRAAGRDRFDPAG